MSRMWIVQGDVTSSGGRLITSSPFTDIDGKGVGRFSDKATCPLHKGTFPIVGGCDPTTIIDGQPVALHGAELACGCKMLATQQMRVFVDDGGGRAEASIGQSAIAVAATTSQVESHNHVATNFNGGDDQPDRAEARDAVRDANEVLRGAGAYRAYDTEIGAAKAWRMHVLPVADGHRVEIGALITQTADGRYHLGGAYSAGAYDNCDGLIEHGNYTEGEVTAYIHTHPYAGGWVGSDRGYSWGQTPDEAPGYNMGADIGSGDLVSAFTVKKNAYIADVAGLHGWLYDDYMAMLEQDRLKAVRLGEAYGSF